MADTTAWLLSRAAAEKPLPATIPIAGRVVSMVLSLVTLTILSICITRRVQKVGSWLSLPLTAWLIIIIYFDSFLFVFVTAMLKDLGINESRGICEGAILLCLVCYMSTKIFIYFFLVEKTYIVRGSHKRRLNDPLYVFNCFGMMLPYTIVVVLNFIWRIAYINNRGTCIIGMEKRAMMPLIVFDVVVNVYLTILFLVPLRQLYSYRYNTNKALRTMALRTFIGSCATLISSVVNLTVLMVLEGEPGWICLMCCNADILFSVLVLHWVTSFDKTSSDSSYARNNATNNASRSVCTAPHASRNPTRDGTFMNSSIRHSQTLPWDGMATVNAQCAAAPNGKINTEDIALDRIVVTKEQIREVESDGRSDRSGSDTTVGRDYAYGRQGSTDGMVNTV